MVINTKLTFEQLSHKDYTTLVSYITKNGSTDSSGRKLIEITSGTIAPGQEPYYNNVSVALTFPGTSENKEELSTRLAGLVELILTFR